MKIVQIKKGEPVQKDACWSADVVIVDGRIIKDRNYVPGGKIDDAMYIWEEEVLKGP